MPDEPADDEVPDEVVPGDDVIDEPGPDRVPSDPQPVPIAPVDTGYTPGGVPTFDSVREKIETRYGAAVGAAELAAETPEGRSVEEQYDARQKAAAERLAEIRESMETKPDPEDQA